MRALMGAAASGVQARSMQKRARGGEPSPEKEDAMFDRDLGWGHWVVIIAVGIVGIPALVVPAGLLLFLLLPVALVAVPVLSIALLARA